MIGEPVGGWAVAVRQPGQRMRLEQSTSLERRGLARSMVTSFGALATAVALFFAADQFTGAALVLWPVAAGLLIVAGLGVLASARAWRRVREGVFLEADRGAATVTGFPQAHGSLSDYRARLVTAAVGQVEAVELTTFEGGSPSVGLCVLLRSGARLEGPLLECAPPALPEAAQRLRPLAEELANLCGSTVRTRRVDPH